MLRLSARWLKNEFPDQYEFEGISETNLKTMTGASADAGTARRYLSPKELVALGIAGCTGVDVLSILRKMRQPIEDLTIETELTQTEEHPRIFQTCKLTYHILGAELELNRVVRAVALSYGKYCGVSAMIKRSGCHFDPRVFLNGREVSGEFQETLREIQKREWSGQVFLPKAAILITGNEILSGKTQDTNSRFIARHLFEMGITSTEFRTVGDDPLKLEQTLRELLGSHDFIFMTGGLGPTKDDLTSEVVSRVVDLPLIFSQDAWNVCENAFVKLGRKEIPESNRKQAFLPRGAVVLENSLGTAAGFVVNAHFEGKMRTLIALPGVPWECESMFKHAVRGRLPKLNAAYQEWGVWNIWGLGESKIQSLVSDIENRVLSKCPDAEFSFQAHAGYVTYLVRSKKIEDIASSIDLTPEVKDFENCFSDNVIYRGREALAERIISVAKKLNVTISVAESCTGGIISSELTSVSGSSEVFQGGIVAYSNKSKKECLNVLEATLSLYGAVSIETVAEMADGAAAKFDTSISLSVTGIAGPTGGSELKPIGTVCFGLSLRRLVKDFMLERAQLDNMFSRLRLQGWNLLDQADCEYVVQKNFSPQMPRELIQKRAAVFGLCSLAAAIESLHWIKN